MALLRRFSPLPTNHPPSLLAHLNSHHSLHSPLPLFFPITVLTRFVLLINVLGSYLTQKGMLFIGRLYFLLTLFSACKYVASSMADPTTATLSSMEKKGQPFKEATNCSTIGMGKKIWRLEELMVEMKVLATEIRKERKRKRKEKLTNAKETNSDSVRRINRQIRRWRKKMHTKLHRIVGRLDEIEDKMLEQKKEMKKLVLQNSKTSGEVEGTSNGRDRGGNGGGKKKKHFQQQLSTMAPNNGDVRKVQIRRRGDEGNVCSHHGDCIPGHCCQRQHDTANPNEAICTVFARKEGDSCDHSCACESQLECFREKKTGILANKPSCKKAQSTDLLNGHYENAEQSIFDLPLGDDESKRQQDVGRALRLPN